MVTTPKATTTKAAATKKAAPKKRAAKKKPGARAGSVLPENHTPSEAAAHAIVEERLDLEPSVKRIMDSDLTEPGRVHALGLFRTSLTTPGDPNRTPANAVEAALLVEHDLPAESEADHVEDPPAEG
jgi:hypothetical protein